MSASDPTAAEMYAALLDLEGAAGTQVGGSQSGAAAAISATLAAAAAKTTYITGFQVTGAGATGASVIDITITGLLGGTQTFKLAIPVGAAVGIVPLIVPLGRGIPASADNTAIVVNVPSFGAGNLHAAVAAQGYQL
jgi:hypothetical protein